MRDQRKSIEPEVYDAAMKAVDDIATGMPSWLITIAVNAAIDAYEKTRCT